MRNQRPAICGLFKTRLIRPRIVVTRILYKPKVLDVRVRSGIKGPHRMLKQGLMVFVVALVAPILYHCSAGSTASIFALLLVDFADSYSTWIIALIFLVAALALKNYLFAATWFKPLKSFTGRYFSQTYQHFFTLVKKWKAFWSRRR
jgi:hypothetical protein